MQLPQPHFFTSERDVAYIDRPQMNLNEGPVAERVDGYHTIWIAEVPFIPGYASETYKDFDFASQTRLNAVLRRQRRFLSDLAQLHEYQASFELRLVSWPRHQQAAQVGIAFLGKVFNKDKRISRDQAAVLWDRFSAIFPKEIPFSYPLIPVQLDYSKAQQQSHSFFEWLLPLPLDQLTYETHPESIVEIRKYEDWPDVHGDARLTDYIPHPFKPALDYATMARLFETLALQQEICVVSAVLRPQHLTERELVVLHDLLARHRQCISNGMTKDAIIDLFKMYMSTRAKSGVQVYERLVHEQRCLFTMRLQVLGIPAAQQDVIEALGSEVVANSNNEPSGLWSRVMPSTPQEFHSACFNARWLEFVRWGSSPLITTDARDLTRLRQLVLVDEGIGAFRLPVASFEGLAGIEVRDEPFCLPTNMGEHKVSFPIGIMLDRGVKTQLPWAVPVEALHTFALMLGEKGEARTSVLRAILQGASCAGIPWVLIRNIHSDRVSLLQGLSVDHFILDTHTQAQLQDIQLFSPPPGVPLPTFIDALLLIFSVTCKLEPASATLLRKALIEVYEKYKVQSGYQITLPDLIVGLEQILQRITAPATLRDCAKTTPAILKGSDGTPDREIISAWPLSNVLLTRVLPLLQELAMATAAMSIVSPRSQGLWTTMPTVIELGLVGGHIGQAFLRGCLWAWFSLALTTRGITHGIRGIVAVEDAHTIFSMQSDTSTVFATSVVSLAQAVACTGVGTLLIDNRPDLLCDEVISEAGAIIVTSIRNQSAQEKAAQFIGASPRERERMRHLSREEAIVLVPGTSPVLITVP